MSSNIYRQADSRWGSLVYPSRPYTLARSGCGCVSVLHCLLENPKYANYTPATIRPYMKQYATRGNGTLWKGIKAGLEHYGYTVKDPNISGSMSKAWEELNKGNRIGVILFRAGTRGGVKWTGGGHYVCFVDYKVKGNKHYFRTKDSSGRKHDGWYCYETTMKGLMPKIWIAKRKTHDVKGKYAGELPTATLKKNVKNKAEVKLWQSFLNATMKAGLAVDGKFGNLTDSWTCQFQYVTGIIEDGRVGKTTIAKAKKYCTKKG